jgi:phenol 2-monooxygenase
VSSTQRRWLIIVLICRYRVLLDDTDITGTRGGKIHERYGISRDAGALVVVRPDGYVGTIAPLDELAALDAYFVGFMLSI